MSVTIESPVVASVIPRALEERLVAQYEGISMEDLIHPASRIELIHAVSLIINEIKAGERVQVIIPRSHSHHESGILNSEYLEELYLSLRGYVLKPDVFAKVRLSYHDYTNVVVDIMCV